MSIIRSVQMIITHLVDAENVVEVVELATANDMSTPVNVFCPNVVDMQKYCNSQKHGNLRRLSIYFKRSF